MGARCGSTGLAALTAAEKLAPLGFSPVPPGAGLRVGGASASAGALLVFTEDEVRSSAQIRFRYRSLPSRGGLAVFRVQMTKLGILIAKIVTVGLRYHKDGCCFRRARDRESPGPQRTLTGDFPLIRVGFGLAPFSLA